MFAAASLARAVAQGSSEESDFAQALLATLVSGAESSARLAGAQSEEDDGSEH